MNRRIALGALGTSLGILLAACGAGQPPAALEPGPLPLETATRELSPGGDAPSTLVPAASTPTARHGLEATDPSTVDLTSGRPTLVEFFAFW